uniref:Uncharacterized protein LOC105137957 isoform X11 n=1 Tax=Rhizophora mucronata TaxID=61149 RepID=A0A2P2P121_RHIMU
MGQELGTNLKLITEKPDKNAASARKASPAARRSLSNIFLNAVPPVSPEKNVNVLQSVPDGRKAFKFKSSTSVTIRNIPSIIQLPHLIEAILIFGKILNASVKTVPNGLDCCDIEFESEESKRRALSVGRVTVKNFNLSVYPFRAPSIVTITICNISSKTSDSAIHSMCMSLGPLEGLVRKTEDEADALFSVDEESDADSILTRLNNTTMENCKWSAHLQAGESTSLLMAEDENTPQDMGIKFMRCLEDLKQQLALAEVYRQDLKYIHSAIMHLQSHPCHKD